MSRTLIVPEEFFSLVKSTRPLTSQDTVNTTSLLLVINRSKSFCIPKTWPRKEEQVGWTCGLYALYAALIYRSLHSGAFIDLPRPVNTAPSFLKRKPSLLGIAKDLKFTTIGEILDVSYFSLIIEALGIPNKKSIQSTAESFLQDICDLLDTKNTVIVSCDIGPSGEFPGQSNGGQAHWVLAFGYCYLQQKLFFLIMQYGDYYLWSGEDLLRSNAQNPQAEYPRSENYGYYYYSSALGGTNFFPFTNEQKVIPQEHAGAKVIPTTTLEKFYFTLFPIPYAKKTNRQIPAPQPTHTRLPPIISNRTLSA